MSSTAQSLVSVFLLVSLFIVSVTWASEQHRLVKTSEQQQQHIDGGVLLNTAATNTLQRIPQLTLPIPTTYADVMAHHREILANTGKWMGKDVLVHWKPVCLFVMAFRFLS